MANLSLRMRDDLMRKLQELAERQGISLNNFINSTVVASVAQEETLRFFDERLRSVNRDEPWSRAAIYVGKQTRRRPDP